MAMERPVGPLLGPFIMMFCCSADSSEGSLDSRVKASGRACMRNRAIHIPKTLLLAL
jgi:hypothetical protein